MTNTALTGNLYHKSTFRFRVSFRVAAFACIVGLCADGMGAGTTRSVPTDGTLEAVLAASVDGDVIMIEEGTYTLAAVGVYTLVDKAVTIRGTGETAADVVIKANGTETFKCFFNISNEHAVVEKVTLTGAMNDSDGSSNPESCRNSSLLLYEGTLKDCIIKDNYQRDLGTVRLFRGLITGCTFDNNKSYSSWSHWCGHGGALFQQGGVVSNCLFTANDARCYGGAAFVRGGLLTHSTFRNNKLERHHGSSIVIAGGTVAHCHVTGGSFSASCGKGGSVSIWRGELRDSDICTNNTALTVGGGVSVVKSGATSSIRCDGTSNIDTSVSFRKVTRCRIFDNTSTGDGAGVYMEEDGTVDHCTISGNKAGTGVGSGIKLSAGTLKNSIVFGNGNVNGYNADNISCTGSGVISTTCTQPAAAGTGNIDKDPLFANAALNDYSLLLGSPCIGAGRDDGEVASDMGALPYVASTAPTCTFTSSKDVLEGLGTVTLTATVANAEGLTVVWDLDDDGVFDDATGVRVDWTITEYGSYPVAVALVNGSGEVQTSYRREDVVRTKVAKAYVNVDGTADFPYATKATGAHTIEEALDAVYSSNESLGEVVVCDGTYQVQGASLNILNPVRVTSENGPATTILQGWNGGSANSDYRVMVVNNDRAIVSGLTLEKGKWYSPTYGDEGCGGLRLIGGTVTNCVIRDNSGNDTAGGVNVRGGLLTHCVIYGNSAYRGNNTGVGDGGGVYMTGGEMNDCVITNNAATCANAGCGVKLKGNGTIRRCLIADNYGKCSNTEGIGLWMDDGTVECCRIIGNGVRSSLCSKCGGGVKISGGTLRNCLISGNSAHLDGAGVYLADGSGRVENCTIVGNVSVSSGCAGLYQNAGTVLNSIIYYNGDSETVTKRNIVFAAGTSFDYNITTPAVSGTNVGEHNLTAAPGFANAAQGDYTLATGSIAIDSALTLENVTNDLAGVKRPKRGNDASVEALPDRGCYEAKDVEEGDFRCAIGYTTPISGFPGLSVTYTASVGGIGSKGTVTYAWNYGEGVKTEESASGDSITVRYDTYGKHSISLVAKNAVGTEAPASFTDLISIGAQKVYIDKNGKSVWPYATWENAATNVMDAFNTIVTSDGTVSEVVVSNGTYEIDELWVKITAPVYFHSANGPLATILKARNLTHDPKKNSSHEYKRILMVDNAQAVCEGFTMTGGSTYNFEEKGPGALRLLSGTVRNCIIRDNQGADNSGGVDMRGGTLENCQIFRNYATRGDNGDVGYGGGIRISKDNSKVLNCVVSNNTARVYGGGIYVDTGLTGVVVSNCVIAGNINGTWWSNGADYTGRNGAGIYALSGVFSHNVVTGNYCQAYRNSNGTKMTGEAAVHLGGAAELRNSLVARNLSAWGAQGVVIDSANAKVVNCTITANGRDGYEYNESYALSSKFTKGTLANTIVWGDCGDLTLSLADAVVQSHNWTEGDPQFKKPEKGNWRLKNYSPCVNAGDNAAAGSDLESVVDLDGQPRLRHKTVDIGCYERLWSGMSIIVR